MTDHLDLDALADVLADGDEPAHLAGCSACLDRLAELRAALPAVTAALASAPLPELPAGLEERLSSALAEAARPAPSNVLPLPRSRSRWMPVLGAAAAAAVVVTGAVVLTNGSSPSTRQDASGPGYQVNSTGFDYTAKDLPGALPGLLAGRTAQRATVPKAAGAATPGPSAEAAATDSTLGALAPADPLAALRTTEGLARCLASLTDPSQSGVPLALDYASFAGKPALVVVLPSSKAGKVDVLVVPPGCAQADGQVLYFTRLTKP